MKKTALPIIFIVAVAAALFYVSRQEHGAGTLWLLAAVLVVGQICASLPFILEARKPRAGTPPPAPTPASPDGADAQKILANQQVIQDDLRSLGETLIRRLNALAERQSEIEKKIAAEAAKPAPDMSADFDELFGKIRAELEERFENLNPEGGSADLEEKLEDIDERLEELLFSVENLAPKEPDGEDDTEEAPSRRFSEEDEAVPADAPDPGEPEEPEPGEADDATLEDFPESGEDADDGEDEEPAEEEPVPAEARQGELELGDFPDARGATLVLEAMLGIENKPFLRGNGAELSEERGVPMEFAEIGKWSFDFAPFREEITVRILKNDDESCPLGEPVTLAPGQNLELAYVPEKP